MEFATKPKIGVAMVAAALDAGVPCAWVLGDAVYGSDKTLRVMLERHDKPYVLSIRGNERLMMGDFRTHTAEDLAASLSVDQWRRLPAGQGSKGPRLDDGAPLRLFRLQSPPWDHWLLIRRSISDPAVTLHEILRPGRFFAFAAGNSETRTDSKSRICCKCENAG